MRASHGAVLCWLLWRVGCTEACLTGVHRRMRRRVCCAAQGKAPKHKNVSALASKEKKAKVRCSLCALGTLHMLRGCADNKLDSFDPPFFYEAQTKAVDAPVQAADADDFLTELNQLNGNGKVAAKGGAPLQPLPCLLPCLFPCPRLPPGQPASAPVLQCGPQL